MLYLGSVIHTDGRLGCEVSRKIGTATAAFNSLDNIWKHRGIRVHRRCSLFESLIMSKVHYGFSCTWLSKAELRRVDGFRARCLRRIVGVQPSFISRVTNERVRKIAGAEPFSVKLQRKQIQSMKNVINDPRKKQLRDVIFHVNSTDLIHCSCTRRVGRPRQNWMDDIFKML